MSVIDNQIIRISSAVRQATGFGLEDMRARDRSVPVVRARMIFCYELYRIGATHLEISRVIMRDRTSIYYLLRKYPDEMYANSLFREMAATSRKLINHQ